MYTVYYDSFEHTERTSPESYYFSFSSNKPTKLIEFKNILAGIEYVKKMASHCLHYNKFMTGNKLYYQNSIIYLADNDGNIIISMTGDRYK